MLVLSIYEGRENDILIGEEIVISFSSMKHNGARLAFEVPGHIPVDRRKVREAKEREKQKSHHAENERQAAPTNHADGSRDET